MDEYINKYNQFTEEINNTFEDFQKKYKNTTLSKQDKKIVMNNLLYTFGHYALFTSHPYLDNFDKSSQYDYINKFILAYINNYSETKLNTTSSPNITKDVFYAGWNNFIIEMKNLYIKIGSRTTFLHDTIKDYFTSDHVDTSINTNKKNRFWERYVLRQQNISKYTPEISCRNTLFHEELPFYYLLFTIYYFSNTDSADDNNNDDDIFKIGYESFVSYKKYGNINKILTWCISCYYEWYDYYNRINTDRVQRAKLLSYIPGIPSFLGHFGFFWHQGIQWHEKTLFNLLDTVNYQFTNDCRDQFLATFLVSHRFYTQPALTNKNPLNKARRDEKKQELSVATGYIKENIGAYFLIPEKENKNENEKRKEKNKKRREQLDKYLCYQLDNLGV